MKKRKAKADKRLDDAQENIPEGYRNESGCKEEEEADANIVLNDGVQLAPRKEKGRFRFPFTGSEERTMSSKADSSYLVTMKYANGTSRTWIQNVKPQMRRFKHRKGFYYIVYEEADYDLSLRQYHLYYHENYPFPLNREVVLIADKKGDEIFFGVKPDVVKEFLDVEAIRAMARMGKQDFAFMKWLLIGGAVILVWFFFFRGGG